MVAIDVTPYPGSDASADEILRLADEYRDAANVLLAGRRRKGALSLAPVRLCAIHAIELYLSAFLLGLGETADQVRARQHDLEGRAATAVAGGLQLDPRTRLHLTELTRSREYLATRYGPRQLRDLSQITLLMATLGEVSIKTRRPQTEAAA